MPIAVPHLDLTHGQAAWILSHGESPSERTLDQLRYLRLLGVPFTTAERRRAAGNRLRYDYDHLLEAAVALFALRRGYIPKDVAIYLIKHRQDLRQSSRQVLRDLPETALHQAWVKSRGKMISVMRNEHFLRLHDRASDTPGIFELLGPQQVRCLADSFGLHERYPGEEARPLLPLTRVVLESVAWAQDVPEIKPGPK